MHNKHDDVCLSSCSVSFSPFRKRDIGNWAAGIGKMHDEKTEPLTKENFSGEGQPNFLVVDLRGSTAPST